MIAAFSPGSDFKRYYRGRMPRLALAVILIMPLFYGALYLWAFWNPFGNVDKMPVAIVNLDEGATSDGERITAGEDVVKGLIESRQLDLHEVSQEHGVDGLKHGEFYFLITIPTDFSEAIASAATDSPRQARLEFEFNDSNSYLSTVIGQDAAEEVINQVNAQVGEQVFAMALGVALDAVPTVESGVESIETLNNGMQQANDGASEIAVNLVTARDGAAQLAGALDEIDGAVSRLVGNADQLVASSGLTGGELADAAGRVTSGVDSIAGGLNDVQAGADAAEAELQALADELSASDDPELQAAGQRIREAQQAVASARLPQEIVGTFEQVQGDANALAGELNNQDSRVNVALRMVEDGGLQSDLATVRDGADQLRSGGDQLSSGLDQLTAGAQQLSDGTVQLAEGTAELASVAETALNFIPNWSEHQRTGFIDVLAEPVELHQTVHNEAKTFAYGFAPFFFGLALFVGGIIAWMLFTPLQARPLAQGLGSFRVVLASYAPTLAVGIVQALILFLVTYFLLGLHPVHAWGTLGFMILMVAMFLAMIQMFNAVFGPAVGRVLTLAFLMIQLTSAGGIYPVPTTSPLFQWLHPFDPMTYTNNGLRQLILGGVDYRLGSAIIVMVALTALFIAVSTWAARRNRQYNMDRLYPPVEV